MRSLIRVENQPAAQAARFRRTVSRIVHGRWPWSTMDTIKYGWIKLGGKKIYVERIGPNEFRTMNEWHAKSKERFMDHGVAI